MYFKTICRYVVGSTTTGESLKCLCEGSGSGHERESKSREGQPKGRVTRVLVKFIIKCDEATATDRSQPVYGVKSRRNHSKHLATAGC